MDFSEIKGQKAVNRTVEVAIAGGHNLFMIVHPSSGKSIIVQRIPSIIPAPTLDKFLKILPIQSSARATLKDKKRCFQRPFRSPHHTINNVGLLGGDPIPGPGEIYLAHNGILFMDGLPQFKRSALEVMWEYLKDGNIMISRSAGKINLPSSVMLVTAMNPYPYGYSSDVNQEFRYSSMQVQHCKNRISGPLLDRIHIHAPALSLSDLRNYSPSESSQKINDTTRSAWEAQRKRLSNPSPCNATMSHKQICEHRQISKEQANFLQQAMEQLHLSDRSYDRILKVARIIADLASLRRIDIPHLTEAIQYRPLNRTIFFKMADKIQKIGSLGGSFDPVHKGHLSIAEDALVEMQLDYVYFIPTALSPLKKYKSHVSDEYRLKMIKLVNSYNSKFVIIDWEIKKTVSYILLTIYHFKK